MASYGSVSPKFVKPTGDNIDIAWQWNSLKDLSNRKNVICDFCGKITSGGITRAKKHQMGIRGDVDACTKTPSKVKALLKEAFNKKKGDKEVYMNEILDDEEEEEGVRVKSDIRSGKRTVIYTESSESSKKSKNVKGLMDLVLFKTPDSTIRIGKGTRTNINDACDKKARARTIQYISRFFCRNGIPFNIVRSKSFKEMVEAIGNYSDHLKVPSYHEMRVPLLKKELEYTKDLLKGHEEERVKHGCSIMLDAWTDRKNRTLINFLVNCQSGSMFVRSVDASSYMKTGEKIFEPLDGFVEEIGEQNVVQVITSNGSNYELAGRLLQAKRNHLFWTPCTAHCVDLMLEDIGKIARVKKAIQRGTIVVGFIYNHSFVLNTMREFTENAELVRHGVTRFVSSFLTLQRLYNQKNNIRKMFTSEDWSKSMLAKERKGKMVTGIVLNNSFWNDVVYSLKAIAPLVTVLRLVANEKKPAMGHIYKAMGRAKESIKKVFKGNEERYKDIFSIIERRWDHHPLHAAGHYLNPQHYYMNPNIENDGEVVRGLLQTIEKLSENEEIVDKITQELVQYKTAGGIFGMKLAIRQRTTLDPAQWWGMFGSGTPNLQKLAIKVLSLTCSSWGCERNWSTFENIHSKKRNMIEHQMLQDLVYIKYNQALKERYDCRDTIDPIVMDDIDYGNEWLTGDMGGDEEDTEDDLLFDDDIITREDDCRESGASEPITLTYTRKRTRLKNTSTTTPSRKDKGKEVVIEQEEEDFDEEEEEIYKLSSDESDYEDELFVHDDDD